MPQQLSFSTTRYGNRVVLEHGDEIEADARLVVVDDAGREQHDLAGAALAIDDLGRAALLLGRTAKSLARQRWQPGIGVDVERRLQHLAHRPGPVRRIHRLDDDRNAGELAVHVGRGEQLRAGADLALAVADRLGAQHQVRKVDVPWVRRNVRAFGHVAEVAQVALLDDLGVVLLVDLVHLAVGGGVDQLEQGRERLAEADAAAAAVADVEDALHLGEGLALVAIVGASPVDRMPGRRLEIAFAQRHRLSINEQGPRGPLSW
jgi:hypothetical protein